MDVRTGSATLAKISTSTLAAPARSSACAQPSTVAPDIRTSSTRTRRRPATTGFPAGGTGCALHIGCPLGSRQPDLLPRRLHTLQGFGCDRHAACGRDCSRQHGRLIESPRPKPAPVQRHGNKRIRFSQQLAAGLADPAPHHGRKVERVAIFESMHQGARYLVETHRRPGAMIGRRVGNRFHGQHAGTWVIDERNAEPFAGGPRDEREFRPACRAQTLPVDRLAAYGAKTRQRQIERRALPARPSPVTAALPAKSP